MFIKVYEDNIRTKEGLKRYIFYRYLKHKTKKDNLFYCDIEKVCKVFCIGKVMLRLLISDLENLGYIKLLKTYNKGYYKLEVLEREKEKGKNFKVNLNLLSKGLNVRDIVVLGYLSCNKLVSDNKLAYVSITKLGEEVDLSKALIFRIINKLERLGYIEKQRSLYGYYTIIFKER